MPILWFFFLFLEATALIYEVFGQISVPHSRSTIQAQTVVLAAFMCGLALEIDFSVAWADRLGGRSFLRFSRDP